jgi:hypothetical protein
LLERASRVHLVAPVRAVLHYLAAVNGDDVMSDHLAVFDAASVGRRDRIAFALAGVGGNGLAGGAQVLANYLQATAEDAPLRAAVRLPRHLQERWGAKTLAEVPVLAVRKALRLPRSQARASAPERNRSASS